MIKTILLSTIFLLTILVNAQESPTIKSFLQNTTETGSHYFNGNSTAIDNNILYNCQKVEYSDDFVYVHTNGIPSFTTGPFGNDGNTRTAESQNAIFKIPLNPTPNAGNPRSTRGGNIGVFINGVALFNFIDGVGWDPTTNSLCGGPGGDRCNDAYWMRDAILAEMGGFDCSKSHPANGNYHSHQNPSAFKLDQNVLVDICNLYDAEGLYAIDSTKHSPLIGYAYDGYPIYGAYAFENLDGTGDIVRMKSSYQLQNITLRPQGPPVDSVVLVPGRSGNIDELFLGYFGQDYEYIEHFSASDSLDEHNGRFSITPEYPKGTYAYFATVDANWNSVYPYVVGPTYYGVYADRKVEAVDETTTVYTPTTSAVDLNFKDLNISIFPNPVSELVAVQVNHLVTEDLLVQLFNLQGKLVLQTEINKGSTIAYFNTETLYSGAYQVRITGNKDVYTKKIVISK